MNPFAAGTGLTGVLVLLAGFGDRQRRRRTDLDRVGWIDWPTVQMLAMIVALILTSVAFHPS